MTDSNVNTGLFLWSLSENKGKRNSSGFNPAGTRGDIIGSLALIRWASGRLIKESHRNAFRNGSLTRRGSRELARDNLPAFKPEMYYTLRGKRFSSGYSLEGGFSWISQYAYRTRGKKTIARRPMEANYSIIIGGCTYGHPRLQWTNPPGIP